MARRLYGRVLHPSDRPRGRCGRLVGTGMCMLAPGHPHSCVPWPSQLMCSYTEGMSQASHA